MPTDDLVKAGAQGDKDAQYKLGHFYEEGSWVAQDMVKAYLSVPNVRTNFNRRGDRMRRRRDR